MDPSERIDHLIADLTDWRGDTFARVRRSILAADPAIVEEWKWMGSPVWSCDGMIAVANAHKKWVKVTFASGAMFADPDHLFNAGLAGNLRRAIDYVEGDNVDERALRDLVRSAIAYNRSRLKAKAPASAGSKSAEATAKPATAKPATATAKPAKATVKPAKATTKHAKATVNPANAAAKPAKATARPEKATASDGAYRQRTKPVKDLGHRTEPS